MIPGRDRAGGVEPVVAWPRITATIDSETDGTLVINNVLHPCWAASAEILRTGMIARCAAVAITLGRPVRLDVTDSGRPLALAVRPDGVVQEIDGQGRIVPAESDLLPITGPCRRCRQPGPVTAAQCTSCGVEDPLGVLAAEPHPIASVDRTADLGAM
jgi:hypothetical protein